MCSLTDLKVCAQYERQSGNVGLNAADKRKYRYLQLSMQFVPLCNCAKYK